MTDDAEISQRVLWYTVRPNAHVVSLKSTYPKAVSSRKSSVLDTTQVAAKDSRLGGANKVGVAQRWGGGGH